MRYLAVLMMVAVAGGLVGCGGSGGDVSGDGGSGGLGLGGGRIEPFEFSNCWYEGGIKDTFAHGKGAVYCLIQGQGKVKQPMTDFCYGEMRPCRSGTYSGREYVRASEMFRLEYDGEWKDGNRHGQGTEYRYFDGSIEYQGEWKDGKRHGQGTFTNVDGSKYVGDWKDGKSHGQGTEYRANGSIEYQGEWKDGKYHGQGTTYSRGSIYYQGEFKDYKYHGQGTLTNWDGEKYVGQWKDGRYHGQGIKYNADGSVRRKGWWCNGDQSNRPCPD